MNERNDGGLEELLSRVLTAGSKVTMLLLAAGFAAALWSPESRPAALAIHVGLLALMATPVARVATSVLAFARAREWLMTSCTLIVLGLLFTSLLAALRG